MGGRRWKTDAERARRKRLYDIAASAAVAYMNPYFAGLQLAGADGRDEPTREHTEIVQRVFDTYDRVWEAVS